MFTDCYCTQFRRSAQALTRLYDEALRSDGILLTQFSLLRALSRLGAATFAELAEEVLLDKTTISRNVKVLDASGWIEFERTGDLREKRISLSSAGRQKLMDATPGWRVAQDRILASAKEIFSTRTDDPLIETLERFQMLAFQEAHLAAKPRNNRRKS